MRETQADATFVVRGNMGPERIPIPSPQLLLLRRGTSRIAGLSAGVSGSRERSAHLDSPYSVLCRAGQPSHPHDGRASKQASICMLKDSPPVRVVCPLVRAHAYLKRAVFGPWLFPPSWVSSLKSVHRLGPWLHTWWWHVESSFCGMHSDELAPARGSGGRSVAELVSEGSVA